MRRALLCSVTLIAIGLMAGCGSSSGGGGGNVPPQPDALDGQYAFVLSGFDTNSNGNAVNPMGMAGSFKADGLGHITAGAVDVNDNGVVNSSSALTGTYSFDANGGGALGTITLTNSVGTPPLPHSLVFGFSLQASGAFGDIMSLDANNFIVTGTMQKQDSSVFSLSSLAGDYIITLNARNAAAPTSALGRFTLAADGTSNKVLFDRSIAGVNSAPATSSVVTFASAGPDTNGRGTFTVTLTDGLPNSGTQQTFDYYAITANRFVAVEDKDATGGTMIADGSRQTLTAITANTTGSVFGVAGVDTTKSNEITAVGLLKIPGPAQTAGNLIFDSNDDGGTVGPTNLAIQTVTFDSTTGRGTIGATSAFSNGLFDNAVFYLTASGTGFILDAEVGITNRAMAGTLSSQSGSPFALSTISGQMILRSRGSSANDAVSLVGLIDPTTTSGVYAIDLDQRVPTTTSSQFATTTDGVLTNVTAVSLDAGSGRGMLSIPTSTSTGAPTSATEVFYVIGANQMVFIDVSPVSSGVNGASSLFFVNAF
jgi:hypothetical protein